MNRVIEKLIKCERIFMTVSMISTILLSTAGVFFRYVLNSSLSYVEEVAALLLAGVIVIGSSLAIGSKEHIRVAVLTQLLPKSKFVLDLFCNLSILLVSGLLCFVTAKFTYSLISSGQLATSLEWLPIGVPLLILPIGYFLCIIKSLIVIKNSHSVKSESAEAFSEY
jgi:TRAP-type C4-dicarboxylate transport system permease small subunit